jgi:hypothetical protein
VKSVKPLWSVYSSRQLGLSHPFSVWWLTVWIRSILFLYETTRVDVVVGSWVCPILMFFFYILYRMCGKSARAESTYIGGWASALSTGILCFILKWAAWSCYSIFGCTFLASRTSSVMYDQLERSIWMCCLSYTWQRRNWTRRTDYAGLLSRGSQPWPTAIRIVSWISVLVLSIYTYGSQPVFRWYEWYMFIMWYIYLSRQLDISPGVKYRYLRECMCVERTSTVVGAVLTDYLVITLQPSPNRSSRDT